MYCGLNVHSSLKVPFAWKVGFATRWYSTLKVQFAKENEMFTKFIFLLKFAKKKVHFIKEIALKVNFLLKVQFAPLLHQKSALFT